MHTPPSTPPAKSPKASEQLFGVGPDSFARIASTLRGTWVPPPSSNPLEVQAALMNAVRQKDAASLAALLKPEQGDVLGPGRTASQIGLFALCLENFSAPCADLLLRHLSPVDVAKTDIDTVLGGPRGFCARSSRDAYRWLHRTLPTLKDLWSDPGANTKNEHRFLLAVCRHAFALSSTEVLQSDRDPIAQRTLLNVFEIAADRIVAICSQFPPPYRDTVSSEIPEQVVAMAVALGDHSRATRLLASSSDSVERYVSALHQAEGMMAADHLAGLLGFLDSPPGTGLAPGFEAATIKHTATDLNPKGTPLLWTVFERAPFAMLLLDQPAIASALAEIVAQAPHRMTRLFEIPDGIPPPHHFERMVAFTMSNADRLSRLVTPTGETAAHLLACIPNQAGHWAFQPNLTANRFFEAAHAVGGLSVFSVISGFGRTPIQMLPDDLQTEVSRLVLDAVAHSGPAAPPRPARTI